MTLLSAAGNRGAAGKRSMRDRPVNTQVLRERLGIVDKSDGVDELRRFPEEQNVLRLWLVVGQLRREVGPVRSTSAQLPHELVEQFTPCAGDGTGVGPLIHPVASQRPPLQAGVTLA